MSETVEAKIYAFLKKELSCIEIDTDVVNQIDQLSIVATSGNKLSISNSMLDLAERLEQGGIQLKSYIEPYTGKTVKRIELVKRVVDVKSVRFLYYKKDGDMRPSGVCFSFIHDQDKHCVVVGAAPFTLVFLSPLYKELRKPEYSLDEYSVCPYLPS